MNVNEENLSDVAGSAFGCWINAVWGFIPIWLNPDISYTDQKEAFLYFLERLLREGKVLLTPPALLEDQEPYYWVIADGYAVYGNNPRRPAMRADEDEPHRFRVWDVPIEKQIAYI